MKKIILIGLLALLMCAFTLSEGSPIKCTRLYYAVKSAEILNVHVTAYCIQNGVAISNKTTIEASYFDSITYIYP